MLDVALVVGEVDAEAGAHIERRAQRSYLVPDTLGLVDGSLNGAQNAHVLLVAGRRFFGVRIRTRPQLVERMDGQVELDPALERPQQVGHGLCLGFTEGKGAAVDVGTGVV